MKILLLFMLISLTCTAQNECGPGNGYTGVWRANFSNGKIHEECTYLNGVKHGVCKTYYLDGSIRSEEEFEFGKLIKTTTQSSYKHDMADFYKLNPPEKINYSSSNNNAYDYQKDYKTTKEVLNDSTTITRYYWKNILHSEGEQRTNCFYRIRYYYIASANLEKGIHTSNYEKIGNENTTRIESTHWHNNGNLKSREVFLDDKPVETHYTYYNTPNPKPESVTYYGAPTNDDQHYSDKVSTRKITKYLDTLGNLTRYVIDYGFATKEVTLKDRSFGHLWYISQPNGAVSGIIDHGRYKIDSIKTLHDILIRNGNGKFNFYPIDFIISPYCTLQDTISIPAERGIYAQWHMLGGNSILNVDRNEIYVYGSDNNTINLPFEVPGAKWKGKIKDGYMAGPWEMRGEIDYKYYKTDISFKGNYEKGLKQGLWKVETDLYEYSINYINDKKEGELEINFKPYYQNKLDKGFEKYYLNNQQLNKSSSLPKLYGNALSLLKGKFKNDEMDGEWIQYYRYPDVIASKMLFDSGNLIAKQEEYTSNQQLIAKREIKDGKIVSEKYFTPLGEEFDMKNAHVWREQGDVISLDEKLLNRNNARLLVWNIFTGEIFHSGTYHHGLKTGKWCDYNSSDTIIITYRNDTLDGYYKEIYNNGPLDYSENKGYYSNGKKSGEWKYTDTKKKLYKQTVYMDDDEFIIVHKEEERTYINEGKGSLFKYDPLMSAKVEEQFENGRKVKTIMTHLYNNEIGAVIYHINNKDSLAYYMPPKNGTCVKNGEGIKTHYDSKRMVDKMEYYEKGSLVKIERYSEGARMYVYYSHYVNDTSTFISDRPFFERIVTEPFRNEEGIYHVSLILKNLPKNTKSIIISDGKTNFKSDEITIINSNNYPINYDTKNNLAIHFTKNTNSLSVELKYPRTHRNLIDVMSLMYRVIVHTTDNKTVVLNAYYPLRTLKS